VNLPCDVVAVAVAIMAGLIVLHLVLAVIDYWRKQ
jgi:hypothetical protein